MFAELFNEATGLDMSKGSSGNGLSTAPRLQGLIPWVFICLVCLGNFGRETLMKCSSPNVVLCS